MGQSEIIKSNKLIAEFMGFIHPYKCDISRGGGVMEQVDLLSKIKFMTLPELLNSTINKEAAPYYNNGGIAIGKYSGNGFYDNVIFFSTESDTVPVTIEYNKRFQAYQSSWDWLMPVVKKCLDISEEDNEEWEKQYENIDDTFYQVQIDQTYQTVVEFIKWYNKHKNE